MANELEGDRPARFFYHLGDIVYLHGERAHYRAQFFEPYAGYGAPIVAIAGNHDGDVEPGSDVPSLEAFVGQFCAPTNVRSTGHARRAPQHQPNAYWTLEHDWMTIIGLYSGVPEGGQIDAAQLRWLTDELYAARPGVTLILALHHPVFSADRMHGSNLTLRDDLDRCFAEAGGRRMPCSAPTRTTTSGSRACMRGGPCPMWSRAAAAFNSSTDKDTVFPNPRRR